MDNAVNAPAVPPSKKRKTSPAAGDEINNEPVKRLFVEASVFSLENTAEIPESVASEEVLSGAFIATEPASVVEGDGAAQAVVDRRERFKALQARNTQSRKQNLKETAAETQRLSTDPSLLTSLNHKHAIASHKLLKADTEAAGEDFERKRAWDWTIEDSEKWDKRMAKKAAHREDVAFQDYRQDARKVYKRQVKGLKPDLEAYEKEKMQAVQKAAANGGLEIIEMEETGELVAVDRDGNFFSTGNGNTEIVDQRPDRAAVDRLVEDLRKAEQVRLRKRRERGREQAGEDGDVTYINDKNKQFNQKLARFYDKYTVDIRESFERGTAI